YKKEIQGITDGINSRNISFYGRKIDYLDVITSNEMYELLSKITGWRLRKGVNPLLNFLNEIKDTFSKFKGVNNKEFLSYFIEKPISHKCNGFIATGNATTNGQMIISNSMWSTRDGGSLWWWTYYITTRWSFILDVNPSEGNRFMMSSAPGYIWSDHDYYQNSEGIAFLETTCPQGPWNSKGLPLAIRARKAIQYGDSIDDVIYNLKNRNDGCMNAVWLIGDKNTGEIARYELGLYESAIFRTKNGFYWSANNPMNLSVRIEKIHLQDILKDILLYMVAGSKTYIYDFPKYRPCGRDIKFEELGNKYYGKMDIEKVKEIMSTPPISSYSTDCKITDSDLISENGIWIHSGNPAGKELPVENLDERKKILNYQNPAGWIKLYGIPDGKDKKINSSPIDQNKNKSYNWTYNYENYSIPSKTYSEIKENILYKTKNDGELLALDLKKRNLIWSVNIGMNPTDPIILNNQIFIGDNQGLKVINLNGTIIREKKIGAITSKPVSYKKHLYLGTNDGKIYEIQKSNLEIKWSLNLTKQKNKNILLSNNLEKYLYVSYDKNCTKIDLKEKSITWNFSMDGIVSSRPVLDENTIYLTSWDNYIYAVDGNRGNLEWKFETGWGINSRPYLDKENVYFGSMDNNLYSLDKKNGEFNWKYCCQASIQNRPISYKDLIIFGCDDGKIYAIDKNNGKNVWYFDPSGKKTDFIDYYLNIPFQSENIFYNDQLITSDFKTVYIIDLDK
ncbi:MAG: PQQ-binding-like beta-propeller repeat protein, partial [Candidatus Thermoplasmatota archaeon]